VGHDQGGQVRITWARSGIDAVGVTPQIIEYAIYRRVDAGFKPGVNASSVHPLGTTLAGWDFVTTVPADAEDEYSIVVPTIADSTITSGQHSTPALVRARTSTISRFYDSDADRGYSVDNLSPSAPNGLVVAYHENGTNALDWNDSTNPDFDYFKIYRSTDPNFVPGDLATAPGAGNLVATTVTSAWNDPDYDLAGVYYKVSAVDFAGNESAAASPLTTTGIENTPAPARFALRMPEPNPFRGSMHVIPGAHVRPLGSHQCVRSGRWSRTLAGGRAANRGAAFDPVGRAGYPGPRITRRNVRGADGCGGFRGHAQSAAHALIRF